MNLTLQSSYMQQEWILEKQQQVKKQDPLDHIKSFLEPQTQVKLNNVQQNQYF